MADWGAQLATLNATLNGSAALLLLAGLVAIKLKKIRAHRTLMASAFSLSILFLISYLTRFYLTGVHRFEGDPLVRKIYFVILFSHTSLAAITPFLALRTLYLAFRQRFEAHRKIARITWPIWMYVSVTGVVVYWMLYHLGANS